MEKISSKIAAVYPTPLVITKQKNVNYFESKINISNLTNDYLLFKIMTNNRIAFSIKPALSFIRPKETAHASVKRFSKDDTGSQSGKDRILFNFYTINKIINSDEEAKEAYNSKLYNINSKQEAIVSVVLKEKENEEFNLTPEYDKNDLDEIGNDYIKGIQIYQDLNEKLRQESNAINQKIKELEKTIGMIKTQKILKDDKEKAIKEIKGKSNDNQGSNKKIMLIGLILFGLIIGANFANLFNRIFNIDKLINDSNNEINNAKNDNREIIINKNILNDSNISQNNSIINENQNISKDNQE